MATSLNHRTSTLASIISQHRDTILAEWLHEMSGATRRSDLMKDAELHSQCGHFIELLSKGLTSAGLTLSGSAYEPLREMLGDISRSRALQGFSPTETATFVFS